MDEAGTEHRQGERRPKGTEYNKESNTINIQRPRQSTANYSMNYYSTGCQAPAKTLGIQDSTTTVTTYHQDQRRSQITESKHEASLGVIDVDDENGTEDDTEDELGDETEDEVAVGGEEESDGVCDRKMSAVFLHLLSHPKCLQVYDDLVFLLCVVHGMLVR